MSLIFGFTGMVFLLTAFVLVPLMESAITGGVDYEDLRKNGARTNGRFEGLEERMNVTINGVHPLVVHYSFEAEGRQRVESMDTMQRRGVQDWEKGREVAVLYSDEHSMISDVDPSEFPFWIFHVVFGGIGGLSVLFLPYAFAGARLKAKLHERGAMLKARLLSVRERVWGMFPRPFVPGVLKQYIVTYAYAVPTGEELVGKAIVRNIAWANSRREGDEIDILFLQEDESKSCVAEEEVMLRCAAAA